MTDLHDPPRLFDSTDAPAGLRAALSKARADVGTDAHVAKLAARLGPLLGPVAPPPAPIAATAAGATKLGLVALALIAAGGGALLLSAPQPSPPSAPTKSAPLVAAPAPLPTPRVSEEPRPLVAEPPPADSAAPKPSLPSKPVPPAQPSEAELLEQARAAIKSDPASALQRANEHAARFPRGVLVQEREVLAIQALRKLGRDAQADRRAAAFAKAFPGSAFQRKLQR